MKQPREPRDRGGPPEHAACTSTAVRLRSHAVQELLAGSGIAVGVALVLGVLVANTSLTSSAERARAPARSARRGLQLAARSAGGFDEALAADRARLPGVRVAAPLLRENVALRRAARARARCSCSASTPSITASAGSARATSAGGFHFAGGLMLPASVAAPSALEPGRQSSPCSPAARASTIGSAAVLGSSPFGALASSPVAVALLPIAQRLTGLHGRVTQVLIEPRPGADAPCARELRALAGGRIDVVAGRQRAAPARPGGPSPTTSRPRCSPRSA